MEEFKTFFKSSDFFGVNLVVEFIFEDDSHFFVDFLHIGFPFKRPDRKHQYLKIKISRKELHQLCLTSLSQSFTSTPKTATWEFLKCKNLNISMEEQRFWCHFIEKSDRHHNKFISMKTTKTNTVSQKQQQNLTVVRQIMVPTMTISWILAGVWMRYALKHYYLEKPF